ILSVPTAFPATADEAVAASRELGFPLLLKPRTQILLMNRSKGALIDRAADLAPAFEGFVRYHSYQPAFSAAQPGIERPMLQMFKPEASESIYSIGGFVDGKRGLVAARASVKILQRPRRMGIGICYEEAPLDVELVDKILALCRNVG